jgi:tellurite resistance protein
VADDHFSDERAEIRQQTRERLEAAADELRETERIAAGVGTDDMTLASMIRSLGFDGDSARVFDLLPLVHVAWADGRIERRERARILDVLELRNVQRESSAYHLIASLLEERPAESWLAVSRDLLRQVLSDRGSHAMAIVDLCVSVAQTTSGVLGVDAEVHDEERTLIGEIAETLGQEAVAEFQRTLGGAPS